MKLSGRAISRTVLSILFIMAGVMHFLKPEFYIRIMPPAIPYHKEMVYLSGFFEILGGIGILIERVRAIAGQGLVLLLLAVFPANIYMALQSATFPSIPAPVLWLRLPFQLAFIYWVWFTSIAPSQKSGGDFRLRPVIKLLDDDEGNKSQ